MKDELPIPRHRNMHEGRTSIFQDIGACMKDELPIPGYGNNMPEGRTPYSRTLEHAWRTNSPLQDIGTCLKDELPIPRRWPSFCSMNFPGLTDDLLFVVTCSSKDCSSNDQGWTERGVLKKAHLTTHAGACLRARDGRSPYPIIDLVLQHAFFRTSWWSLTVDWMVFLLFLLLFSLRLW